MTTTVNSSRPTIGQLFTVWLKIGFTSFGGGAVTQYLIQENFIHKYRWITAEEYSRILAMCQVTPGMGIIASTTLIAKYLGGWIGILVSLIGLILPSAAITIGITVIYTSVISRLPQSHAVLQSVFAAIFGIGLATNWRNAKPILSSNLKLGLFAFIASLGIMLSSVIVYLIFNPPVIVLYIIGGFCGAVSYWYLSKQNQEV